MGFVTGAFPDDYRGNSDRDDWQQVKRWLAVLHLFDAEGNHLNSEAKLGGFDIDVEACEKAQTELEKLLRSLRLRKLKRCDIYVKQFAATIDGVTHSLLYSKIEPKDDSPAIECVLLEPRDIMFHPPWDSGEYST